MSKLRWFCVALLTFCAGVSLADEPTNDPVQNLLFPPEVLMQHRQAIGLTGKQIERIQALAKEAGPQAQERQTQVKDNRVTEMMMIAVGDERSRWGNARFKLSTEPDAQHLMAGHPIDLDCRVRYGLVAKLPSG